MITRFVRSHRYQETAAAAAHLRPAIVALWGVLNALTWWVWPDVAIVAATWWAASVATVAVLFLAPSHFAHRYGCLHCSRARCSSCGADVDNPERAVAHNARMLLLAHVGGSWEWNVVTGVWLAIAILVGTDHIVGQLMLLWWVAVWCSYSFAELRHARLEPWCHLCDHT